MRPLFYQYDVHSIHCIQTNMIQETCEILTPCKYILKGDLGMTDADHIIIYEFVCGLNTLKDKAGVIFK